MHQSTKVIGVIGISAFLLGVYLIFFTSEVDPKYNSYFNSDKIKIDEELISTGRRKLIITIYEGKDLTEGTSLSILTQQLAEEIYKTYKELDEYEEVIVAFINKQYPIRETQHNQSSKIYYLQYDFNPKTDFWLED